MLIELYIDFDQRKCLLFISLRPLGHQDKRSTRCCCYENIRSNSARDLCWHYWQVVTWLARVYLVFSSMKARRKHLLCRAAGSVGKGVGDGTIVPPHTGRDCFNQFQISFSANTTDAPPGVSGVSKDQKFCLKFKNAHCQVDHPAKIE